jgi:pectate lyase
MRTQYLRTSSTAAWIGCCLLLFVSPNASAQQPAFPGAEGFGALTTGGRGGDVHHVTNLDDAGPGSLRDAVSKSKRIVVFDVGGYIELKSILHVASDLTIAGQTAPGEGIGTMGSEVSFSSSHNIICRYMRFRQGDVNGEAKKCALNMHGCKNIMLDHLSIQFGRWDVVGLTESSNVTLQHSIIGPGIAPQRFGCLCQAENVTFSHNLFLNNHGRNPKAKGKVQFINNVVYNWELGGYNLAHSQGKTYHDVINNCFLKGPITGKHGAWYQSNANDHVYATGNTLDGKALAGPEGVTVLESCWAAPPVPVKVDSAQAAYDKIVAGVGCALHRDALDTLLVKYLTTKTGGLLNSQKDLKDLVGGDGFGTLPRGQAVKDRYVGLHPTNPEDRNHIEKASGYTRVEAYINGLAEGK